jgi:hypothetical protein
MIELSFKRLRQFGVARCIKHFHRQINEWSPTDWGCAMAGETGEACNILKKMKRIADNPESVPLDKVEEYQTLKGKLADELADIQTYLDLTAARFDLDLGEITVKKFNEVSDRINSDIKL